MLHARHVTVATTTACATTAIPAEGGGNNGIDAVLAAATAVIPVKPGSHRLMSGNGGRDV